MPIKVACQCGQQFAAKDELAGKTVRCPKCSQPLTIPARQPQPAAAGGMASLLDEAGMEAATTEARCPSCGTVMPNGAVVCVNCGYNAKTGRKMATLRVTEDGDEVEQLEGVIPTTGNMLLDKASRELRKEEIESAKQWTGMPWWVLLIMFISMIAFTVVMMVIPPATAMFISMIMFLVLFGLAAFAMEVWLYIIAFSESTTCGLLYFFFWPYRIYYVFTRWDQCAAPVILLFLLSFLNSTAVAALMFLVPALSDTEEVRLRQTDPRGSQAAVVAYVDPAEMSAAPVARRVA